jgi:hypothetical protein
MPLQRRLTRQADIFRRRRRPLTRERALQAFFREMAPIRRAETERAEDIGLIREGREQEAKQHAESLALTKAGMRAEETARERSAGIARRGLDIQERARKEAKRQARIGLGLQGTGLGIQALQAIFGDRDRDTTTPPWPRRYPGGGGGVGTSDFGYGGGGWSGFSVPGGLGVSYGTTWG